MQEKTFHGTSLDFPNTVHSWNTSTCH